MEKKPYFKKCIVSRMNLHWCSRWDEIRNPSPILSKQSNSNNNNEIFYFIEKSSLQLFTKRTHVSLITLIFSSCIHIKSHFVPRNKPMYSGLFDQLFQSGVFFSVTLKYNIHIREIGYLTDSKKVTITTIPRPME